MFAALTPLPSSRSRQAEIIEVVARNGWGYFRSQLSFDSKPEKPSLPLPDVLRQILIDLGPTFVKLGQILSTRPDLLSPEYIQALETLQSEVPALPWSEIAPILEAELQRPLTQVFAEIEPRAIAAGSLAQVHRGKLFGGQVVAVKIQRPGIRRLIERDLEVLRFLADLFKDALGEAYDLPGLVEEFRISLSGELDFRREARNTEQLGASLAQSSLWARGQVVAPKVYDDLTSERVLILEWIEGIKLTDVDLPEPRKKALAALATQVVMQQMFLDGIFHADPHPGNFLYVTNNGKEDQIALLDFGMVAILDPRTQRILTDLLTGIVYEQPREVAQAIRELGFTQLEIDIRAIESSFDRLLRRFYTRPLEEINMAELLNEALRIPRENKIQMPGTIGLFAKAVTNVEGIARRLDPLFPFVDVARPVIERAIQHRLFGPGILQDTARSSLYLSRFLIQFPQRLEILVDRLERSELGLNLRWRDRGEFQQSWSKATRRLSLAVIAGGTMLSGSQLLAAGSNLSSTWPPGSTLFWSQGLLMAGFALGVWLIGEFVLRP